MGYLTPDSVPVTDREMTVQVPDNPQWIAAFKGAILELSEVGNWEEFGSLTPEETAAVFRDRIQGVLDQ